MRKLLNNPKVVAVLAIVAVGFVGYSVYSQMPGRTRRAKAQAAAVAPTVAPNVAVAPSVSSATPAAAAPSLVQLYRSIDVLTFASAARDPFALPLKPAGEAPLVKTVEREIEETVRLTATWSQAGNTWVLINGKIFRPGDAVGRMTIESATRDGVWVSHWRGREFVAIGQKLTLKTPARLVSTVSVN